MQDLLPILEQFTKNHVLEVNTRHLPSRDISELHRANEDWDNASDPIVCTKLEHGLQVMCSHIEEPGMVQAILDYGYTTALTDWLQYGFATGCSYIVVRGDAPVYPKIPTFDW